MKCHVIQRAGSGVKRHKHIQTNIHMQICLWIVKRWLVGTEVASEVWKMLSKHKMMPFGSGHGSQGSERVGGWRKMLRFKDLQRRKNSLLTQKTREKRKYITNNIKMYLATCINKLMNCLLSSRFLNAEKCFYMKLCRQMRLNYCSHT